MSPLQSEREYVPQRHCPKCGKWHEAEREGQPLACPRCGPANENSERGYSDA
jgi:NADH pyrophosphatase NudC (nudix superfamily)